MARTRKQETLESLEALSWVSSLQDRVCHLSLSEAEIQEGAKARQNDTKRACRKFPTLYEEHAKHVDWQTSAAKTFQKWAEEASWTTCPECKRLRTQRFPTGSRPRCRYCVNGTGYFAPSPADVPVELRACLDASWSVFGRLASHAGQVNHLRLAIGPDSIPMDEL